MGIDLRREDDLNLQIIITLIYPQTKKQEQQQRRNSKRILLIFVMMDTLDTYS